MRKNIIVLIMFLSIGFLVGCRASNDNSIEASNDETFTVQFHFSETEIETIIVSKGDTLNLPMVSNDDYVFMGWTAGTGINDGKFTNTMPVYKDLELYPIYEEYRVNINIFIIDNVEFNMTYVMTERMTVKEAVLKAWGDIFGQDFNIEEIRENPSIKYYADSDLTIDITDDQLEKDMNIFVAAD